MPTKEKSIATPHKSIHRIVTEIIKPSIKVIQKSRNRKTMPYADIKIILDVFFPKTKHYKTGKGFFKHVFIIHTKSKKYALKIGRKHRHMQKDYTTYKSIPEKQRNRYFAKIYWRDGLFMLQKYGRKTKSVPPKELQRLKKFGNEHNLKDIRAANVMKFGNRFKIVDAERRK